MQIGGAWHEEVNCSIEQTRSAKLLNKAYHMQHGQMEYQHEERKVPAFEEMHTTMLSRILMRPASSGSTTRKSQMMSPMPARAAPGTTKAHPQPHCRQAAATTDPKMLPTLVWAFHKPAPV